MSHNHPNSSLGHESKCVSGENTDVWENLREIFEDIDAQSEGGESKHPMKKSITHLRHLLQMHSEIQAEEICMEKIYLGLRIEREWYLSKLQAIEAAIRSSKHSSHNFGHGSCGSAATLAFIKAVRSILHEDKEDYQLISSKSH